MHQERKRYHSSSTLASISEPGGCYGEIIKYLAHLARKAKRKLNRYFKRAQGRRQRRVNPDLEQAISLRRKRKRRTTPKYIYPHQSQTRCNYISAEHSPLAPRASPEISDIDPMSSPRRPNLLMVPSDISANPSMDSFTPHSPDSSAPPEHGDLGGASYHGSDRSMQHQSSPVPPPPSSSSSCPPIGQPLSRNSSSHGNTCGGSKVVAMTTAPEVLSVHSSRPPALMTSRSLLSTDYDPNRSQYSTDTDDRGTLLAAFLYLSARPFVCLSVCLSLCVSLSVCLCVDL